MYFTTIALSALAMLQPALAFYEVQGCEDLSGCTGECTTLLNANDDQTFGCMSASFTHAIKTEGLEAAGKRIVLFADQACDGTASEPIGEHKTDGWQRATCGRLPGLGRLSSFFREDACGREGGSRHKPSNSSNACMIDSLTV